MRLVTSIPVVLVILATGCSGAGAPAAPSAAAGSSPAVRPAVNLYLSGSWDWSETTVLQLTPPAAGLFGLAPEGPVTHVECESAGELTLTQAGSSFSGQATQSSSCTTKGSVTIDPALFPPGWTVEGELTAQALSFTVDTGIFPCHYRGSVRVDDGEVSELTATGACEVPRELGNDKILGFRAVRQ